jgi:hypothetical protein
MQIAKRELQQCGTQGVTVLLRMLQLQLQYADATFQRYLMAFHISLGWTLCVVFFGKNGFSEKNHRQKRPPFFPVILSEKTLFPLIFAT